MFQNYKHYFFVHRIYKQEVPQDKVFDIKKSPIIKKN